MLPREKHFNPVLDKDDSPETIYKKIFNSDISILHRTLLEINTEELKKASEVIVNASKIVFFGSGASLLVAKDTIHKLMKIGVMAYVYEDVDLQFMASSLLVEKDVAIAISHSGSNYNAIKCVQQVKENGCSTISIVSIPKSPLSKITDISLHTAYEETVFESEYVSSRIAQLAILDSLIAIMAFENYDFSYQSIQRTRESTTENKF